MVSAPKPPEILSNAPTPVNTSAPAPPVIVTSAVAVVFAETKVTAKLASVSAPAVPFATTPEALNDVIAVLPAFVSVKP